MLLRTPLTNRPRPAACWSSQLKPSSPSRRRFVTPSASSATPTTDDNRDPAALLLSTVAAGMSAAALGWLFLHNRPGVALGVAPPMASLTAAAVQSAAPAGAPGTAQPAAAAVDGEVIRYKLMQILAMPAWHGRLATILAVVGPLIGFGCVLYRLTAGETWRGALHRLYMLVGGCPGSGCSVDSGKGVAADVVLHTIFWVRMCTFCIAIGLVTESISSHVHHVRFGNWPVVEREHTVLLGWNKHTMPVLQQMANAHNSSGGKAFPGSVVILADLTKDQMDNQVADELDAGRLKIITRSGNPAVPRDQQKVAAATASTVLLLWPSELSPAEASAQQAAVLLALEASGGIAGQKIVVQTPGDDQGAAYNAAQIAVRLTSEAPSSRDVAALPTSGSERLTQLIAQVAQQPGLERVLADLLKFEAQQEGAEFYTTTCPAELAGQPFQHVRRCYDRATLVGFKSGGDRQLSLNPPDAAIVPAGSQLLFVANSESDLMQLPAAYEVSSPVGLRHAKPLAKQKAATADNVTMLCFDPSSAACAVKSMVEFSPRGSTITVICDSPNAAALTSCGTHGVKVNVVVGDPTSNLVLDSPAARLQQASAVVLSGLDSRPPGAADAQVLASVLQLQSLAARSQRTRPLAIVGSLNNPHTEHVLQLAAGVHAGSGQSQPVTLHMLQPNQLLSGMLAETALAPELAEVFDELLTQQQGHEIYLRQPQQAYRLPLDTPLAWKDVQEAVRACGHTAIGLVADGKGRRQEMRLGVAADSVLRFQPGDRLVVIALD